MCKQVAAYMVLIAGLVLLLLCFVPGWVICVLGFVLIAVGCALLAGMLKKGR